MPLRPTNARGFAARAVVLAIAVGIAGCGGSDGQASTSSTTRPPGVALTDGEAASVAQMLFRNYQAGGATVSAAADYSPQLSVAVNGEVDWKNHTGALTMTSTFADGRPQEVQEVVFTQDAVYTKVSPEQAVILSQQGKPDAQWVVRAPDREGRPVDQLIGLLVSLASTRPDNPQLVLQGEVRFDREEQIGDTATEVFTDPGKDASYWVATDTGQVVRFRGTLPGFAGPITIDFSSPGSTSVSIPADGVVSEVTATTQPG